MNTNVSFETFSDGIQASMLSNLKRELYSEFMVGHLKAEKSTDTRIAEFYKDISSAMYTFLISKITDPTDSYNKWINSHGYNIDLGNKNIKINPNEINYRELIANMEINQIASYILLGAYKEDILQNKFNSKNVIDQEEFVRKIKDHKHKMEIVSVIDSAIRYFGLPNEKKDEMNIEYKEELIGLGNIYGGSNKLMIEDVSDKEYHLDTMLEAIEKTLIKQNGNQNTNVEPYLSKILSLYASSDDNMLVGNETLKVVIEKAITRSYVSEKGIEENPRDEFNEVFDNGHGLEKMIKHSIGNDAENMSSTELKTILKDKANLAIITKQIIQVRNNYTIKRDTQIK